ncbi:radical SAM protein [Alphaproteobacteria bacterium]|nr:radical SAM protein [Alphaproteobacteria bacterium]
MKTEKSSSSLGSSIVDQNTIGDDVDIVKINKFLLKNLDVIKHLIKPNDKFGYDLFNYFEKNKKINFPINKQNELFIFKYDKDLHKITQYLIFRYKFHLAGKKKIDLGYPPYLLIEPVSTCNLRCPFCFQTDKTFTRKPFMGVMDFDLFKNIVDQADEIGVGALTLASRGEPTMHKKFINMLEYINSKKNIFEVKINTNGTFLNEKICHAIFDNNVTQVVISSDHYIKEHYEKLRLGSNFEEVVNNVDLLYNIREKFYSNSITEIRISGIDNDRNLDRKKFRDFWIYRSDHVTCGFPLERWNTYLNIPHPEINDHCHYLWDRMYIWFDGKVNPCDADYKSLLSYGDARETSIKKLWNNQFISKTRSDHACNKRNEINPCDRCGITFV